MALISKILASAAVFGFSMVASANSDLMGDWKTKSVTCVSPKGNAGPTRKVDLNLRVEKATFTAVATLDNKSCNLAGTYTYSGGTISFKVTDSGGCPMGGRDTAAFEAVLNGREAIVSLQGLPAAILCNNTPTSLDIVMKKL